MRAARVTALALAALLPAAAAGAQKDAARAKKQELGEIQRELESTRREIDGYQKVEQSLDKELRTIQSRTGEERRRMENIQQNMRAAERKKQELKSRLTALGQASGFWQASLDTEVRAYARGQASRADAFGRGDLWKESFRRAAMKEKAELLTGLQGISRTTALAQAEARRKAEDLAQRRAQAQKEQLSTQREYEEKKAAIAEAQGKVAAAQARAKELEETAKALTRLIRGLREPRKPGAPQTVRWDVPVNSLLWPAQGSVLKPFGRQRNPELDTWVISQGIMLQTPPEAAVSAVRGGKVIFCGPFRSYGQVMILDHGSNFFTIYGGLGSLLKAKGAEVQPGETIAKAGSPRTGQGGRLYFELRRGTEALDPMVWLQKQGKMP